MLNIRRLLVTAVLVGFVALWTGFFQSPAMGQIMIGPDGRPIGKGGPKPDPKEVGAGVSAQFSSIKLIEDSDARRIINAARDIVAEALREKNEVRRQNLWAEAADAIQKNILDMPGDAYVQIREKDNSGREVVRWTSVKFEANNLFGSMPEEGLDVYDQKFGARAGNELAEAKRTGNRELLAKVAQNYLYTKAGIEANELLATYFLDRGQFFMAALRYEKLLAMKEQRAKLSDLSLFKATLAYRRAGDAKNYDKLWKRLQDNLGDKGLKIGDQVVALDALEKILNETPQPQNANPYDWPYVRGNERFSAQATGSPPLLDMPLFIRPLVKDKTDETGEVEEKGAEAKQHIETAINQINGMTNTPVLPGSFPVASNKLLIYRSHSDVRAINLQDEKDAGGKVISKAGSIAWKSTDFDGALSNILADGKMRVTLQQWIQQFNQIPGFSSILYENSLVGTLSTDHRFVYAVDDLTVPAPANVFQPWVWQQGQIAADVKPLVLQNTLYAFNVQNGRCEWRLGGGQKDEFADSHFLGVPVSVGGKLYVLNEKNPGPTGDAEIRLVCIDPLKIAGGKPQVIEPIQSIGAVMQAHRITHDIYRRTNAVHLAYGEGILVCPTNAGEVLGIDILSRSLVWSYPYREQTPKVPFQQPNPGGPGIPGGFATNNWRSAPPALVDGKVVFTAPDANSIHCINLRDGTPVWKKRQSDNDLYFAGAFNGKALIVAKNAIRALSVEDGRQLWYIPTGDLPSGQGVASKNIYYLPLKKGEIMAIDIEKGTVKAHNRAKNQIPSPGNLVFYEGTVVSQTPLTITGYPQLVARLDSASAALKDDPKNPEKLIERGELLLADGQLQPAVDDLRLALEQKPADALLARNKLRLYEALTDLLQADFPKAAAKYLDEYKALSKVEGNDTEHQMRQAKYFRIVGQGRETEGNLVDAFQMYREFGALKINDGGIASLDDPTYKIPTSVWLRARVSGMLAKAVTKEQKAALEKKIADEWKIVEEKKDIDAIRSFVGMFDVPFEVGREARLRLAENIMERNEKASYLEAEMSLLQLLGPEWRGDAKAGGRALAGLAKLEEKKSTEDAMKLAASYYRQLKSQFPNVPVRGKQTGEDLYNNMATDPRFRPYLAESNPWGQAKMKAHELPPGAFNGGLQGFIFQPEGDLTPMMRQHRLVLDPSNANNPQLRLVDLTTNNARWSQNLGSEPINFQYFQYLYQQGQANNAYLPNAKFRHYQVKGHIAVYQVGAVVFCLDMENAKILWQQKLTEAQQPNQPGMMVQQVLPDQDGYLELIVWNQFNGQRTRSAIGHVGAVQASYVALVGQKGLMVLDPVRGQMLWKKMDVSASTRVFGDENFVFLVESNDGAAGSGRVLRAGDGLQLDVADFGGVYQNRVKVLGRRILASYPGAQNHTLKLYDIPTGKDVWSKAFDGRSVVLQTEDPSITGIIEPNGKVTILDVESGRQLATADLVKGRVGKDDLKNLYQPLLVQDAERYYVALNKAVDSQKVQGGVLANNFSNGLRCAPVNGWVVAFHRKDGAKKVGDKEVAWKAGDFAWHSYNPMHNQMLVLEQMDQLPILLFSSRYNELINGGAGGNRWVSLTQSIDKRTGKMIFDPGPRGSNSAAQYYAFNVDLKGGAINMIGFGGALQHYIDDGRKPAPIPGTAGGGNPMPGPGKGFGKPGFGKPGFPGGFPPDMIPPGIELPPNIQLPPNIEIELPIEMPERPIRRPPIRIKGG